MTSETKIDFPYHGIIAGEKVIPQAAEWIPVENPATGEHLGNLPAMSAEDVDQAVKTARSAFESGHWSRLSAGERKAIMLKWADLIEAHGEELAMMDALEAGKPISDCRSIDIPESLSCLRWYGEAADKLFDRMYLQ